MRFDAVKKYRMDKSFRSFSKIRRMLRLWNKTFLWQLLYSKKKSIKICTRAADERKQRSPEGGNELNINNSPGSLNITREILMGPKFSDKLNAEEDARVKMALFQFLQETKDIWRQFYPAQMYIIPKISLLVVNKTSGKRYFNVKRLKLRKELTKNWTSDIVRTIKPEDWICRGLILNLFGDDI